jgi:hypothetical protein
MPDSVRLSRRRAQGCGRPLTPGRSDGDEVPPVCELEPGVEDGVLAGRPAVCELDPGVEDGVLAGLDVLPSGGGVGVAGAFGVTRRRWVSSVPGVWAPVLPPVDGVAGVLDGRFMVDGDVPVKPLDGIEVEAAVEVVAGRPCDQVPADPVPIDEAPYGLEPGIEVLCRCGAASLRKKRTASMPRANAAPEKTIGCRRANDSISVMSWLESRCRR